MSSPNKKRRNCTRYKKSWAAGTRGGGKKHRNDSWKDKK